MREEALGRWTVQKRRRGVFLSSEFYGGVFLSPYEKEFSGRYIYIYSCGVFGLIIKTRIYRFIFCCKVWGEEVKIVSVVFFIHKWFNIILVVAHYY